MGGITPLAFTGISKFSDDFQTILNRSVSIANIPLLTMQNEQTDILTKKQLFSDLRSGVADLSEALKKLGTTGKTKALAVSSSNTARVTASLNGATQSGTYSITDITSIAKAASETTSAGYATATTTPIGDGKFQLVVGTQKKLIDISAAGKNNLNGLRDAINAAGLGVSATVLNTGTGNSPYFLAITSNTTGAKALQLRDTVDDAGSNILTAANQGADAIFKLNGQDVTKSDNVVSDVIPGVTFTVQSLTSGSESVDIKLSSSRGVLATDLADLATKYNAVREKVNAQVGETAGLLSGDYLVREIQHDLRSLASFQSSGSIKSLADMGIEFDELGMMSFNTDKFYSLSNAQVTGAFEFLGSETTGFGALSDTFDQISDPISGLIKLQQDQFDVADDRLTTQITELATRIQYMQVGLSSKLQQADVLLAQLESQQTMIGASIDGLNLTLYGKKDS